VSITVEEKYYYGFCWHGYLECEGFVYPQIAVAGPETEPPPMFAKSYLSSNHPGGVNAFFCDGHFRPLSVNLAYDVYAQLMTPWGARAARGGNAEIDESMY
jgi:prepilin-type processing-associated H-X9-DG protein